MTAEKAVESHLSSRRATATEGLEGKNHSCAFRKTMAGEEVEEVEAKNSYCSSRRTMEVVKEVELKNRIHSSRRTRVEEEVELQNRIHFPRRTRVVEVVEGGLGVKRSSCSAGRPSSGKDIQQPLLAMKSKLKCDISTNHCLGTTAEEAVEMVGVKDNCSSRRTPSGKGTHQPALLRKSTSARDISKTLKT